MTRLARVLTAVLAAVAIAACGGGNGDTAADGGDGGDDGGGGQITMTGTNGLAFEPAQVSAPAGTITVELTAEDQVNHNFTLEEGDQEVVAVDAGETATGEVELEAGEYAFYCSVPGHREAGMEGTLTVEG